jgi:hypothetical protein
MKGDDGQSVARVCEELGLPKPDRYSQDWFCELPRAYRSHKWLRVYENACIRESREPGEKRVLVSVALDVVNELIMDDPSNAEVYWSSVVRMISNSPAIHMDQLSYWFCEDCLAGDDFACAPLARSLWSHLYGTETR